MATLDSEDGQQQAVCEKMPWYGASEQHGYGPDSL